MIPGHTKFSPDRSFGTFKNELRKNEVLNRTWNKFVKPSVNESNFLNEQPELSKINSFLPF